MSNKLGSNIKKSHCFPDHIDLRQKKGMGPISRTGDTVLDLCPDVSNAGLFSEHPRHNDVTMYKSLRNFVQII